MSARHWKLPVDAAAALYWLEQRLRGRGSVRERLRWLETTQWLPPKDLAELQDAKLRKLVEHCHRTVPYYREVMAERGLAPKDIQSTADLPKLPLLTRNILAKRRQDLLSSEADRATLQENYSSGSTGVRAQFQQDLNFRAWMRAHQLRTYQWCGRWRLGEPFVLLWGSEIYWSFKNLIDRVENAISNRREINTFRLSRELIARFVRELAAFRPALVSTYSNAMHLIAREAERQGVKIAGLRAVQGTSEPLPQALRDHVARIFDCEIYDKYGMRETNIVSHESPAHDGMCIQVENVCVEFLRDGKACAPGEQGRIVVTALNNFAMPLLRYETSDIGGPIAGVSTAGLGLPRMTHVAGREQDLILTPRGDHIDAYFFSYLFMRFAEIHWFQVIQTELERLHIRVYAPDGLSKATTTEIRERLEHHAGSAFAIELDVLAEMPDSATGKFRLCVNELPPGVKERSST
jgi:phenylacetate-CoA ligase